MTADSAHARVGLISDTHSKLDSRVFDALQGVDFILHAGDIGTADVLWKLEGIASVIAVLGNTDLEIPGFPLGQQARIRIAGKEFLVIHDIRRLGPVPEGIDVVVHGHTHVPAVEEVDGVLLVNPGPARRPTKGLSRTVGIVTIDGDAMRTEIVSLDRFGPKP
jgi:putative phosphoesterase